MVTATKVQVVEIESASQGFFRLFFLARHDKGRVYKNLQNKSCTLVGEWDCWGEFGCDWATVYADLFCRRYVVTPHPEWCVNTVFCVTWNSYVFLLLFWFCFFVVVFFVYEFLL